MNKLPDITKQFPEWYQEVVYQAELVDQAPVRGCFVIRPYGYAIWENITAILDKRIKETGHQNAAFPLLIPESFIKREAEHVAGFAPELAVVTHAGGKELEEPLVVRPTSETIIHYSFARWIKSWRDLPMKINQWASVVRWEKRPRAFLRTSEFFWQEGHTAHETLEEASEEAEMMMQEYINVVQNYLAVPVISGLKSDTEKFPGADKTITFEAVMPDGKALQMGTSHLLSRSFAKSFNIEYQNREGKLDYPYLTSWGFTTRTVGAMVMMHGDQKGLILPPRIAPIQVVIIPILKKGADNELVLAKVREIEAQLIAAGIRVKLDADDSVNPGSKYYHWELKGVPARLEVGPRDLQEGNALVVRRHDAAKKAYPLDAIVQHVQNELEEIQAQLFERAQEKFKAMWHKSAKLSEFGPQMDEHGGIFQTGWCKAIECEQQLKNYKGGTRCLLRKAPEFSVCFACDKPSTQDVLVAKSY